MANERTLSIIKPDAVAKNVIGEIYSRFEKAGLNIVAAKMMHLTQEQADKLIEWYQARPDGIYPGFGIGGRGFGFKGHRFSRGGGHHRFFEKQSPPAPQPDDTSL